MDYSTPCRRDYPDTWVKKKKKKDQRAIFASKYNYEYCTKKIKCTTDDRREKKFSERDSNKKENIKNQKVQVTKKEKKKTKGRINVHVRGNMKREINTTKHGYSG